MAQRMLPRSAVVSVVRTITSDASGGSASPCRLSSPQSSLLKRDELLFSEQRLATFGADEDLRIAHGPDHQRRGRKAQVSRIGLERQQRASDVAEDVFQSQGAQDDL